ncbi:MAG: hypothetical protein JO047_17005 [Alphaproteobacteria bacterium]|nr:hypothetical protein [Alphaproteobacteria bacterium]
MRKLLFAGAVLAAPLLAWQPAHAAMAAPLHDGTAVAPSASLQKVTWVWVGGRRVWHPTVIVRPGYAYGYRPGWVYHPGLTYYHPWHPGWAYPAVRGHIVVRHWG